MIQTNNEQGRCSECDAAAQLSAATEREFGAGIAVRTSGEVSYLSEVKTPVNRGEKRTQLRETACESLPESASLEERVARIKESVERSPAQREILYQTLVFYKDTHSYEEGETFIANHKAYNPYTQSPRILIDILVRANAINVEELDCNGQVVTDAMKDELRELEAPEEEIEDLIVDWRLSLTEQALSFLEGYCPAARLSALAGKVPEQTWIYRELLAFCRQKRTLGEINSRFPSDRMPRLGSGANAPCVQISTFVNRLNESGGLSWNGGWLTTREGEEFLDLK